VRSDRIYWDSLAQTTARLRGLHALRPGLTFDQATDILWVLLRSPGLAPVRRRAGLGEQASLALLRPGG
jgi:hypothetical protein